MSPFSDPAEPPTDEPLEPVIIRLARGFIIGAMGAMVFFSVISSFVGATRYLGHLMR